MGNCKICGAIIHNKRIYCSNKCKEKRRYNDTIYIKNCSVCGEEFPATKGMTVCSPECSLKAQRKYIKTCPMCKKEFNSRGNGTYCSEVCYRTANSKTKGLTVARCEVCSTDFRTSIVDPDLTCSDICDSNLFKVYIDANNIEVFGTSSTKEIRKIIKARRTSVEE